MISVKFATQPPAFRPFLITRLPRPIVLEFRSGLRSMYNAGVIPQAAFPGEAVAGGITRDAFSDALRVLHDDDRRQSDLLDLHWNPLLQPDILPAESPGELAAAPAG